MVSTYSYSPAIFNVGSIEDAKRIILTQENDLSTDERWRTETPQLIDLMARLDLSENSLVLDYGCGIGRLSRALIDKYGCRVVGADISPNMRAFASHYVASGRFAVCAPEMLETLGVKFDAALSVWVLQHCHQPANDISIIRSALKDAGQLFVVNEHYRCVPTPQGWVSDGLDVAGLLESSLKKLDEGEVALGGRAKPPYWARYTSG